MTYPFDTIRICGTRAIYRTTISSELAVALIVKFLQKNNCFHEYVEAWKGYNSLHNKKVIDYTPKQVVENSVIILSKNNFPLDYLFQQIQTSFDWLWVKNCLNQKTKWMDINIKWQKELNFLRKEVKIEKK